MTTKKKTVAKKQPARRAAPAGRKGPAGRGAHESSEEGPLTKNLETVLKEVTAEPVEEHLEEWQDVQCPYCGESFEIHVTSADNGQTMIEDCHVCCRPISLHIALEEGELQVTAHRS